MSQQHEPGAKGPEELREQVERTRQNLGETVKALAGKVDVKARVQEKASEVAQQAARKAEEVKSRAAEAASRVQDKLPDPVKDRSRIKQPRPPQRPAPR